MPETPGLEPQSQVASMRAPNPDTASGAKSALAVLLSFTGLVGVLALAYLRVLFFGETFATRDHLTWTLPSRTFLGESLRRGHLPEWWDGLGVGERFAGDPNNGVTYPVTWIVGLMDPLLGADLLLLFHILLAGVGMHLLTRRLGASRLGSFLGAAGLMTSGYMTSMVVNGSILMSLGWMPLVAWAALGVAQVEERRAFFPRGLIFAAVVAGSVASGNPAHVNNLVLAGALVVLVARRRGWAVLTSSAAVALGLLMGSASLLVPLATLGDSARTGGLSFAEGAAWSMHPLRLIELVWPQLLGNGLHPQESLAWFWGHGGGTLEPLWSGSVYVGLPILLCAFIAALRAGPVCRRLGLLSLVFLVLALGAFTPVYRGYRALFWFERFLRYPEKHLASAMVLWSGLAAVGFDRLFDAPARLGSRIKKTAMLALLLLAAVAGVQLLGTRLQAAATAQSLAHGIGIDAPATVAAVLAGGWTAVAVAFCIPLVLAIASWPRGFHLARSTLVVVVLAHLVAHDWQMHALVSREWLRHKPAILAGLDTPGRDEPPRVLRRAQDTTPISVPIEARAFFLHQLANPNQATLFGFDQVPAYSIAGTQRFAALAAASGKASLERVMDLLDIRYLIIGAAEAPAMGMPARSVLLAEHVLLENVERRARAFVAYRWKHGVPDPVALDQLFAAERSAADLGAIRLAGPGSDEASVPDAPTPCRIDRPYPERIRLHCRAARAGYAVLLDEWTQGWSATVDLRPCPIERADTIFRAVAVPPGEHVIEMTYETPGLREGAQLSLAGWLVFLALLSLALLRGRAVRRSGAGAGLRFPLDGREHRG